MQCRLAISQCNEVDQVGCIIINATEVKKAMLAVGRSACNPRIRIIALVSDMDVHHTHFHIFLPNNHTFICTLSQYSLYLLVLPPCTRLLSLIHFLLFPLWTHLILLLLLLLFPFIFGHIQCSVPVEQIPKWLLLSNENLDFSTISIRAKIDSH